LKQFFAVARPGTPLKRNVNDRDASRRRRSSSHFTLRFTREIETTSIGSMKRSIYFIAGLFVFAAALCCLPLLRISAQAAPQTSSSTQQAGEEQQQRIQRYNELVQEQQELAKQQEDRARRIEALLVRQEKLMDKQEAAFARFEKILDTWEKQQQQYQKYLDSLPKS
jgi:septal ring factor EnvC (AmiA/AmiB activator)